MDKIQPLAAKTVYVATPISENPEKVGWYNLIDESGELKASSYYFKDGNWYHDEEDSELNNREEEFGSEGDYTHWLKPITSMERLIGDIWDAAISYAIGDDAPDRTTFIQQLLNPGK